MRLAHLSVSFQSERNVMSTTTKGKAGTVPDLDLILTGEEGSPVAEATWAVSDAVLEKITSGELSNPYVVLLVAERRSYLDYLNKRGYTYHVTDVYIRALHKTPKVFPRFRVAGENVVVAGIVDVTSKKVNDGLEAAREDPRLFAINIDEGASADPSILVKADRYYDYIKNINVKFVNVDQNLFAPAPPRWQQALVTHLFGKKAVDQCYFWWRLIFAALLTIPVQVYGLFARVFSLGYGLFMAKRGMEFKKLFALNPHSFGNSFGTSFWFKDKNYQDRQGFLWKLTPPWLLRYAVVLAGAVAVLGGVPLVILYAKYGSELPWRLFLQTALVVDGALLGMGVLIFFGVTRTGRGLVKRGFGRLFKPLKGKNKPEAATVLRNERQELAERIRHQSEQARAGEVKNTDLYLLAYAHKADSCKPYQGGVLGN